MQFFEKQPIRACAVCGFTGFNVLGLVNTFPFRGSNIDISMTIPLVLVACGQCAHVLPFSATQMGVPLPPPLPTNTSRARY